MSKQKDDKARTRICTDRLTDRWQAISKAHSNCQLKWAKNFIQTVDDPEVIYRIEGNVLMIKQYCTYKVHGYLHQLYMVTRYTNLETFLFSFSCTVTGYQSVCESLKISGLSCLSTGVVRHRLWVRALDETLFFTTCNILGTQLTYWDPIYWPNFAHLDCREVPYIFLIPFKA